MSVYFPDYWSIIKIEDAKEELYKVFACWSGSYLHGASWKINSGIESIKETEHTFLIDGYSGSIYECAKGSYGMNGYGMNIYQNYAKQTNLKLLTEEEALEYIKEKMMPEQIIKWITKDGYEYNNERQALIHEQHHHEIKELAHTLNSCLYVHEDDTIELAEFILERYNVEKK